ncbi:alpha-L-arabinofuranosidase C-terminal domain-containing protein, partial [Ruminococcus sp.]
VPYIETIAVENGSGITLFAVNRSADESCELELNGFENYSLVSHTVLTSDDMKRCNSIDDPDAVSPVQQQIGGKIDLAPRSWNMLKFTVK